MLVFGRKQPSPAPANYDAPILLVEFDIFCCGEFLDSHVRTDEQTFTGELRTSLTCLNRQKHFRREGPSGPWPNTQIYII